MPGRWPCRRPATMCPSTAMTVVLMRGSRNEYWCRSSVYVRLGAEVAMGGGQGRARHRQAEDRFRGGLQRQAAALPGLRRERARHSRQGPARLASSRFLPERGLVARRRAARRLRRLRQDDDCGGTVGAAGQRLHAAVRGARLDAVPIHAGRARRQPVACQREAVCGAGSNTMSAWHAPRRT